MEAHSFNVVIDAFWGSSGKGKVCDWLTATRGVTDVASGNMPNAGHTIVRDDEKRVLKVLPSGAPFNKDVSIWLAPTSGFYPSRLLEEAMWIGERDIKIHERAFHVLEEDTARERNELSVISSTMQGSGAALAAKIMRSRPTMTQLLNRPHNAHVLDSSVWRSRFADRVVSGTVLYEISQGWGLSIDHGTHYPHCTSRNCSVAAALDACATPPQLVGDVIAVIRPYPIRVGNTEDGFSGGFMQDCCEVDWTHVRLSSGLIDAKLEEKERTTVTKRIRRVSTFSFDLLLDCCKHNGVTGIFLNFAQYIDAACAGKRGKLSTAPKAVRIFADAIESCTGLPVIAAGTGADTFDVLEA